MAESRTVRARVNPTLAAQVDATMEREGRTESDIVRRALDAYCGIVWNVHGSVAGYPEVLASSNDKVFRGPDPKRRGAK